MQYRRRYQFFDDSAHSLSPFKFIVENSSFPNWYSTFFYSLSNKSDFNFITPTKYLQAWYIFHQIIINKDVYEARKIGASFLTLPFLLIMTLTPLASVDESESRMPTSVGYDEMDIGLLFKRKALLQKRILCTLFHFLDMVCFHHSLWASGHVFQVQLNDRQKIQSGSLSDSRQQGFENVSKRWHCLRVKNSYPFSQIFLPHKIFSFAYARPHLSVSKYGPILQPL